MKAASALSSHRKSGRVKSVCAVLAASLAAASAWGVAALAAGEQFFAGDGSALSASKWGATAAGPFTSAFTNGSVANFSIPNGTGAGGTISVGGINATENFTITSASGTLGGTAGAVNPISVSGGKTFDAGSQVWSGGATVGFSLNGGGVLATSGGMFAGGFVLNSGTLVARGVNAMGAGGTLTVNGGTIAGSGTRDFTGKYPGGIKAGGNFQLGALATVVAVSGSAANLTFGNNVALGAATRTITIGANGTYTLAGSISGSPGAGLTVARLPGATGRLVMSAANTYNGNTTVGGGTLALVGSGSIANSPAVEVAGGATLDVSGLAAALTLADGQALRASGTTSSATIATAAGKGLTLAPNSPLQFTAFGGATAPLTVAGAGTVTLSGGNPVVVNVTNGGSPLGAGDYTLISKGSGGGVAGTAPASLTVGGDGVAAGTAASLQIVGQQLILHVAPAGTLQFGAAAYGVGEAGVAVGLSVTRAGGSGGAVSVSYATGGGTAAAGGDYTPQSGTLNWAAGDAGSKTINVNVADDTLYEGDETFVVTLTTPTGGATLGTPSAATVTISDNESAPVVSVSDVTLAEPAAPPAGTAFSYAAFDVTLSGASAQPVTVSYSTADGTAVAPGDYASLNGTVAFSPGETRKTVAVAVKSDSAPEGTETFSLDLSGPVGASLADGSGVASITRPVAAGPVFISEFRLRGPSGQYDEFVEVYNNTDAEVVVADANPATCALQAPVAGPPAPCGWALLDLQGAAAGGVPRFVIPPGTTIPARGHYLAAGRDYSLSALAAPDQTYDPPSYAGGESDNTGLALYRTADRSRFDEPNLLDAVGFGAAAPPFREGTGLLTAAGLAVDTEHSFVRNQGSGRPADTGDNRADFTLVAADPSVVADAAAVLGAPGPENRAVAVQRNGGFSVAVPAGVASSVRRTSPAVTNGALGTLSLRRRFTNNTGQTLSRLRFRVTDLSTWNGRLIFGNQAEVRVLDATLVGLSGAGLLATTVEAPPQRPHGGGVNSGLLVNGSLTLARPLAPGQGVDVEFLLGVMKGGSYQFIITVEAAP